MGAYLSEPITKKISSDEAGRYVAFGASSMQGWRVSQEDAHNCCIDFDENASLFAVYDGHGGHEVATYSSQKLPDFIKNTEAYKNGNIEQALIDAFLGFDATLANPEIVATLKKIAGTAVVHKEQVDSCDSSEEDTVTNLRKEAEMPLEQVMLKYQGESLSSDKSKRIISPAIRCRRANSACSSASSSSTASCSSSWNTNEADVSSSSSSTTPASSDDKKDDIKKPELPGSSDSDQLLDSTSNGDAPYTSIKNDSEATKTSDMPDSSEDVDDNGSNKISSNSEVNGEKNDKNSMNSAADSSKNDNVSSSCNSCGNGDAGQQEGISSSSKKSQGENLYRNLLQNAVDNSDDESDSDDDENDETFSSGMPEESDEDEYDDVEGEEAEELEDESDVDDEDEQLEDADEAFNLIEEPGTDSGCTAVVAVLRANELYVANAGDSRCVLCRDGEATELSLDHKPEDAPEMERIIKAGGKVTSEGRVNGGLNLSRALGDHAYKQNKNLPPAEQMISAMPDVKRITIDPKTDEFMILACDGIWNFMSSEDVVMFVRERLKEHDHLSKICEELFDYCLAPNTIGDGTGCDNMTAVIVKFKDTLKEEVKNNGNAGETSVSRKRPMSPVDDKESDGNSAKTVKNDITIEGCKRNKMEAV